MCLSAGAARADVLTIGDDGAVSVQRGPALYLTPDLAPTPLTPSAAGPSAQPTPAPAEVREQIRAASDRMGLDPALLEAVAWRESGFNPAARSPKGARGVMQLMPGTARDLGVDPDDPGANITGGGLYLRRLLGRYDGDVVKALAAYNAGPGAVDRHGGVPPFPETRSYVAAILDRMSRAAPVGASDAQPGRTPR
ncbi:MAG TPA: transglycosylase SLT domain-containing protein [Phenylobacterium sp.]|nr:transglycosylase SLT domain-containing protein [Phenylobacterium sp.]